MTNLSWKLSVQARSATFGVLIALSPFACAEQAGIEPSNETQSATKNVGKSLEIEDFADPITGKVYSKVMLDQGTLTLPFRLADDKRRINLERQERGVKLNLFVKPFESMGNRNSPWDRLGRKDVDWLFEGFDAKVLKPELGSPIESPLLRTQLENESLYLSCLIAARQCSGTVEDEIAGQVDFRMTLGSVDEAQLTEGVHLLAKTLRQIKGQQPWYEWTHRVSEVDGVEVQELSGPFGKYHVPSAMHIERGVNHPTITAALTGPDYSVQMSIRFTNYPYFFRAERLPDEYRLALGAFEGVRAYRLMGPEGAGVRGAYYYFGDADGLQWIPKVRFTCTHRRPAQECRGGANFNESGVVTYVFSGDHKAAVAAVDEALGRILPRMGNSDPEQTLRSAFVPSRFQYGQR